MIGLDPIMLRSPAAVTRALRVGCPVCREKPGTACQVVGGKPEVHDRREALAFHLPKVSA